MPESTRLFLALWPDDAIRAKLAAAIAGLDITGRITPIENLHVTLVFLGSLDADARACLERALTSVRAYPFDFVLSHVQWRRRNGMVWLDGPETPAALTDLAAKLRSALVLCGHVPESRPYRLHVTIARDVRRMAREHTPIAIPWRAIDFCLVSSKPAARGSQYTVERRWPLAATARNQTESGR